MDLPIALKTASEKLVVGYKQAQLKKIAQDLSDRYRNESGAGKVLLSKELKLQYMHSFVCQQHMVLFQMH